MEELCEYKDAEIDQKVEKLEFPEFPKIAKVKAKLTRSDFAVLGRNRENFKSCQLDVYDDIGAVNSWLDTYRHKDTTYRNYLREAKRFILWCVYKRGKIISDLTKEDLLKYFRFLENPRPPEIWCGEFGKVQRGGVQGENWRPFTGPLKGSTLKTAIVIIKSLFSYLVDAGYLQGNPCLLIKKYKTKINVNTQKLKVIERILSDEEWNVLLDTLRNMPEGSRVEQEKKETTIFLVVILYLLGLRINELATHTWNSFCEIDNRWWFFVKGKGDKEARIPVTDELLLHITRYRSFCGLKNLPSLDEDYPIVISFKTNRALSVRQMYRIIKGLGDDAAEVYAFMGGDDSKLKRFSPHWLRHLCASHQDKQGFLFKNIKENLRHANESTTHKYIHAEDNLRHDEMNKLNLGFKAPDDWGKTLDVEECNRNAKFNAVKLTITFVNLKTNFFGSKENMLAAIEMGILKPFEFKKNNESRLEVEYLLKTNIERFKEESQEMLDKIKREAFIRGFEVECKIV